MSSEVTKNLAAGTTTAATTVGTASAPRLRGILRGESAVASIGIASAAILLGAMAVLAYCNTRSQREALVQTRRDQVHAMGAILSQSAEAMLVSDDISAI